MLSSLYYADSCTLFTLKYCFLYCALVGRGVHRGIGATLFFFESYDHKEFIDDISIEQVE